MRASQKSAINGVSSTASTQCTNDQQWTRYHSKQGHGFAAEDANAMYDRWHGKSVDKVGLDNSLNGADRISDGIQIQSKYCVDAIKSVNSESNAFVDILNASLTLFIISNTIID